MPRCKPASKGRTTRGTHSCWPWTRNSAGGGRDPSSARWRVGRVSRGVPSGGNSHEPAAPVPRDRGTGFNCTHRPYIFSHTHSTILVPKLGNEESSRSQVIHLLSHLRVFPSASKTPGKFRLC